MELARICIDAWSLILRYLPLKSVFLLLETGDTRIRHIRQELRHLELNRSQIRFKPFPTSFLCSWSGLHSLSISVTDDIYDSLPDSLSLPSSIRSLTLVTRGLKFLNFVSLLYRSYVSKVNDYSQLTEIKLLSPTSQLTSKVLLLSKEETTRLANFIEILPLASLSCTVWFDLVLMSHLPSSLTFVSLSLVGASEEALSPPEFPPHLLTLNLNTLGISWSTPLVFPSSMTDISLNTSDKRMWMAFPAGLMSLKVPNLSAHGSVLSGLKSLTTLQVKHDIPLEILPLLPRSLLSLEGPPPSFGIVPLRLCSSDARHLPPCLTHLRMYTWTPEEWPDLPRSLTSPEEYILMDKDYPLHTLPPVLKSITLSKALPAPLLDSISCRDSLTSLHIRRSPGADPINSDSLLALSHFASLTCLDIADMSELASFKGLNFVSLTELNIGCPLRCFPPTLPIAPLLATVPPHLFIPLLPQSCTDLRFTTLPDQFSFDCLSRLPSTLKHLEIAVKATTAIEWTVSLAEILTSLPRCLNFFSLFLYRSAKIVLSDCLEGDVLVRNHVDSSQDMSETPRFNIFLTHLERLPFLQFFSCPAIDPNKEFKRALDQFMAPPQ